MCNHHILSLAADRGIPLTLQGQILSFSFSYFWRLKSLFFTLQGRLPGHQCTASANPASDHQSKNDLSFLGADRPRLVYDERGKLQLPDTLRLELFKLRSPVPQDFHCQLCNRHCASYQHLDDHILGVHWKVPRYQCYKCGNPYRYRGDFARHVKKC